MKKFAAAAIGAIAMTIGIAHAEDQKQSGPGTTGAVEKSVPSGVATDPEGVKAQQGDKAKSSPGTVGAAPGGDTKSQTGK